MVQLLSRASRRRWPLGLWCAKEMRRERLGQSEEVSIWLCLPLEVVDGDPPASKENVIKQHSQSKAPRLDTCTCQGLFIPPHLGNNRGVSLATEPDDCYMACIPSRQLAVTSPSTVGLIPELHAAWCRKHKWSHKRLHVHFAAALDTILRETTLLRPDSVLDIILNHMEQSGASDGLPQRPRELHHRGSYAFISSKATEELVDNGSPPCCDVDVGGRKKSVIHTERGSREGRVGQYCVQSVRTSPV